MSTVIRWGVAALFAVLAWLVTEYTVEYFRPYKKISVRIRQK